MAALIELLFWSDGMSIADEGLEVTVKALIDRLREAPEGSAEHREIDRRLTYLLDSDDRAGLIAEEYQSLLLTSTRAAAPCP